MQQSSLRFSIKDIIYMLLIVLLGVAISFYTLKYPVHSTPFILSLSFTGFALLYIFYVVIKFVLYVCEKVEEHEVGNDTKFL